MRKAAAYALFLLFSTVSVYAADSTAVIAADTTALLVTDTLKAEMVPVDLVKVTPDQPDFAKDSVVFSKEYEKEMKRQARLKKINRVPKPEMAAWIAAICPGAGQIYNRQYWKVPIIYAGFAGLGYAITWNNDLYVEYRRGYTDLCSTDPNAKYYEYLLPEGVKITSSNIDYYKRTFKSKMEGYQRNRDLSILATAVLYLLSIIDSYVDSQLRDYDVSPDLSMQVAPAVIPATKDKALDNSVGVSCRLKF